MNADPTDIAYQIAELKDLIEKLGVPQLREDILTLEKHYKRESARTDKLESRLSELEPQMMDLREEVHDLAGQVSRGNVINLQTQGAVGSLRRDTLQGFADVHDSQLEILEQIRQLKGDDK